MDVVSIGNSAVASARPCGTPCRSEHGTYSRGGRVNARNNGTLYLVSVARWHAGEDRPVPVTPPTGTRRSTGDIGDSSHKLCR
ncbi:hypothetical protein J6590_005206 [Homalodisca vitripennis]|nr:hypothetical protein J6590_005206 [Homalodisca vitripennis]